MTTLSLTAFVFPLQTQQPWQRGPLLTSSRPQAPTRALPRGAKLHGGGRGGARLPRQLPRQLLSVASLSKPVQPPSTKCLSIRWIWESRAGTWAQPSSSSSSAATSEGGSARQTKQRQKPSPQRPTQGQRWRAATAARWDEYWSGRGGWWKETQRRARATGQSSGESRQARQEIHDARQQKGGQEEEGRRRWWVLRYQHPPLQEKLIKKGHCWLPNENHLLYVINCEFYFIFLKEKSDQILHKSN